MQSINLVPIAVLTVLATAHAEDSALPIDATMGPNPTLVPPKHSLVPTVKIAPAKGWGPDEHPSTAPEFDTNAFATELTHPRWLYVLPNGDVLVAETNAPERPDDGKGIKGRIQKKMMARAGATVPSPNRITLLRDANGDGNAETKSVFIENLNSPFGMVLVGNDFYVADTDAILKFSYTSGQTKLAGTGTKVADLPAGSINHHWTKNLTASQDGKHLYASIGSNSNVAENGIEAEQGRAGIVEVNVATGQSRSFASGLRNPVGMDWQPQSRVLWVAVNERDELGNDLVPDYMTAVKDGGFYGWPYSYFGQHVDNRVEPTRDDLVQKAIVPDYALGAHTASLGLTFYTGHLFPQRYVGGAFVGQHGSWNREPLSGYRVIFVPFSDGRPSGKAEEVLTGFVNEKGEARGRPVGVAVDRKGALLVADDVGNAVWRVVPATSK